jgi:DNA-binding LytR/AlgR family response regulator
LKILSCIIIDEDKQALALLSECIELSPFLSLAKSYNDPLIAQQEILQLEYPIDLLFTEIEMKRLSGLELAKTTSKKVNCLVLVSSKLKYALKGYDVNARQFLSKPLNFHKFEKIIGKLLIKLKEEENCIVIKLSGKNNIVKLCINDIIAIESFANYLKIHTPQKVYIPYGSLHAIEKELMLYGNFKRISRFFIINITHIRTINQYKILLIKDLEVSVGESYRKQFDDYFRKVFKRKK